MIAPTDKDFVAAMSNGTSGDVNNINFGTAALKAGPGDRTRLAGPGGLEAPEVPEGLEGGVAAGVARPSQ